MDRNEVLERLDVAGADRGPIEYEMVHVSLLRAAAEIIRESGWRPIAEAPEGPLTCGKHLPSGKWISYHFFSAAHAAKEGYTHYLPEPAPPTREVENG